MGSSEPRHTYKVTVNVKCPHGQWRSRPADEIMVNFTRELIVMLAPYDPRVDVESHCAFGESLPLRLDGEVVA